MLPAFWRSPLYVLSVSTFVVLITVGVRQSFGLYMQPISADMGWGREVLSLTVAVQNLMIGLMAPIAAGIGDKWGPLKVLAAGATAYALGVFLMSQAATPTAMLLSGGFVAGVGVSGCGLSLLVGVVGRVAPDHRRSLWLGVVTAGGTLGQFVFVPIGQAVIGWVGWGHGLLFMAACIALIVPLSASLRAGSAAALGRKSAQTLSGALREARAHSGYALLTLGFFVCGFQVQFIASHLPAYLTDAGLPAALGAAAIATIGLFNLFGTFAAGWLGGRYRMKRLLSLLYLSRALVILAFVSAPLSEASVLVFAAAMGLLWLSTVPLTSGIVAGIFGTRYMATLFAIVYLSHQLGSFTGVWLGGLIYDLTGSYDRFWWIAIVMGLAAALIHWPIDDRPLARLAEGRA